MTNQYRVRFVIDEDHHFEECNGEPRPLTAAEYAENVYRGCTRHPRRHCDCSQEYWADISYEEYRAYYGNPDRHVYLGCVVDRLCAACGHWEKGIASVWGIDFMDDAPEYDAINVDQPIPADEAIRLPGYAGDVAREELHEAGYVEPAPA